MEQTIAFRRLFGRAALNRFSKSGANCGPSADHFRLHAGEAGVRKCDLFWARSSIGPEALQLWLETYQTIRSFQKRGIVELELP